MNTNILNSNSYLQSSNFKIFLPFIGDDFVYAQNISLPGFNLNPPQANTSGKTLYVGGDHIDYDPITVGFLCGEDFNLYKKLVKFISTRIHQNSGILEPLYEFTCGIEITDNKGNPLICFMFYGCKINSLGGLQFISNAQDIELNFDLTFYFDDWEMIDYFDDTNLAKIKQMIIKS